MKNDIKKVCILSLILTIVSIVFILLIGKTYVAEFSYNNNENCDVIIENRTGEIEILEEKQVGNKYLVKVKGKKNGKAFLIFNNNGNIENKYLYVHKSMILTDNNYFGKSTGSEVIPISLSIILIYILYLLIKKYNYCKNDNLYQYKNIAYLGIIIFLSFFVLNNIFSIFRYQGLYRTINDIIGSMSFVSFILFPIALITSILVTISNIRLIMKEGMSLRNLLGLFLGMFICIATLLPDLIYNILMKLQIVDIYNLNTAGPYIYNFLETVVYLTVSYIECILIGTIIIAIKSVKKKINYDKDYMIILGCQIKKDGTLTPLLKGRVDKAIEFRNKQMEMTGKDLVFIPSGGKGNDEIISEAEAIKNYLLDNGIKNKHILLEDKSRNTYQNIKFSNKLINDKKANIAYSTTNYHVLRAGLIATEQGLKLEGIGSKTKLYFWINAFIREFIGTLYSEKRKHIIVFLLIMLVIMIMVIITYFANNI